MEQELMNIVVRQLRARRDQALFFGLGANSGGVQSAAIVADRDQHLRA
jgi:hypothetical protein